MFELPQKTEEHELCVRHYYFDIAADIAGVFSGAYVVEAGFATTAAVVYQFGCGAVERPDGCFLGYVGRRRIGNGRYGSDACTVEVV